MHTDATVWEAIDLLETEHGRLGKGAFEELEKDVGFNWDPDSLLADKDSGDTRTFKERICSAFKVT